jgi:hypothetical protein
MSFLDDLNKNPRALNSLDTVVGAAGDVFGALSHIQYGQEASAQAAFQAAQLRQNAGQAMASAQRDAYDIDRQSQYIASSALARAAASGAGASDPTVVNLIARNATEFAYRKSVALYQGEERARLLNLEADAKDYEGESADINAKLSAGANLFKAGTTLIKGQAKDSMLARFGGTGPQTSNGFGGL